MKWLGWICAGLLGGIFAAMNVSGGKRLSTIQRHLSQEVAATEKNAENLRQTGESRRVAVEKLISEKQRELSETKAAISELEAKHGPLLAEFEEIQAPRRGTTPPPRRGAAASPDGTDAAAPRPQTAQSAAGLDELRREIETLRAELARYTLR